MKMLKADRDELPVGMTNREDISEERIKINKGYCRVMCLANVHPKSFPLI